MNSTNTPLGLEASRQGRRGRRGRQAGLTLVEIMVALGLGLVLLLGAGATYLGSKQTFLSQSQEGSARIQDTGRYLLEIVGQNLRQAGNSEIGDPTWPTFSGSPIYGVDGGGTLPDVLTVQYDAATGDNDCNGNAGAAGLRIQNSYNLDKANVQLRCDGVSVPLAAGVPTPDEAGLGSPIVDGVEDFQILYGIDNTGDQSVDLYVLASALNPCPAGAVAPAWSGAVTPHWCQVVSVRVCFLVRSTNAGVVAVKAGSVNAAQKYMNCGGALGTLTGAAGYSAANDTYLRRAFVATFALRTRVP